MKHLLCIALLSAPIFLFAQQSTTSIFFKNNIYTLTDNDQDVINELAAIIISKNITAIEIIGYADSVSTQEYNMALSKKRADVVYNALKNKLPGNYLEAKNISSHITWSGENIPKDMHAGSHYGQRCTDIIISYTETPLAEKITVNRIRDLYDMLQEDYQTFCIDPSADTVLAAKDGTIIIIKANSFSLPQKYCGASCLSIKLMENYTTSAMITNRLSTTSNGQQLETGGMLDIYAEMCGVRVPLAENSSVVYMMPAEKKPSYDMELFYGTHDPHGDINWLTSGKDIDVVNGDTLLNYLNSIGWSKGYSDYCPLFFCRIGNIFRAKENRIRSYGWGEYDYALFQNKNMDSLMKAYGMTNLNELRETLVKERTEKFERDYTSDSMRSSDDFNFYVFSSANLGSMNCDRFTNTPENLLTSITIDLKKDETTDARLIFKNFKSVMQANAGNYEYTFSRIQKKEPVWVYAVKYENDKIYMSLQETSIGNVSNIQPEFKEYTMQELKAALKTIGS